jgi:hypothetical protein
VGGSKLGSCHTDYCISSFVSEDPARKTAANVRTYSVTHDVRQLITVLKAKLSRLHKNNFHSRPDCFCLNFCTAVTRTAYCVLYLSVARHLTNRL